MEMSAEPPTSPPLSIADLVTVLNDTFQCRAKWYNLGIQLRVVVGTLDCFKVQYGDPGDQLREVLRTWLTSSDNPTWMALTEALKSPVIEETRLARELQTKYCSSRQRPVDVPLRMEALDVRAQVRTLQNKFFSVATRTSDQIRRKKVDAQDFRIEFVMRVDVSQRQQYQQSLQSCLMKLETSISIEDLLCRLSMHWDFFNYGLLEHTINTFGDASLQQDMEDYVGDLRDFRVNTKLCDFIDNWPVRGQDPPTADFNRLVIKMGKKWEECTLEDIEKFRETLTHKFFLPNFALLLREAEKGCVCLTWYTPAPIAKTIQESLPDIEIEFFEMYGIQRININGQDCFLTLAKKFSSDLKGIHTSGRAFLTTDSSLSLTLPADKPLPFSLAKTKVGDHALIIESYKGHSSLVRKLLQAGATVNTTTKHGQTALYFAAHYGHEDVVEQLLEAKADPDLTDKKSQETVLMMAARNGSVGIIKKLIYYRASVNLTDEDGKTALYVAAQEGHEDIVELLLKAKADPELKTKKLGDTALITASYKGHSSVVSKLLQAGATVNTASKNGNTALTVASHEGHSSVVQKLLEAGATVNITNKCGHTALYFATSDGHEDVVELLLQAKADPNLTDMDGDTALTVASSNGHSSVVRKLLNAGATVNTTTKWEGTALCAAANFGHEDVVEILLNAKADPNLRNEDGRTALYIATQEGHEDIVRLLLEAKADPDVQDELGDTALTTASYNGNSSLVRMLLQAEATLNTLTKDGYTALHFAASNGHEDVVELLLGTGADPDLTDMESQETALMVAAREGSVEVIRKLIQHGARMNLTNKAGLTALDIATQQSHTEVYEELLSTMKI